MSKDAFDLAAEEFEAFKENHPGDPLGEFVANFDTLTKGVIEFSIAEFEAIKKRQGWTNEEAMRWLQDKEPLPDVKEPMCDFCQGTGTYPIFDRWLQHRYDIKCPECGGLRLVDE